MERLGGVLEDLRASWRRLGGVLERLGGVLERLEASWSPLASDLARHGKRWKIIDFHCFLSLGRSCRPLGASWGRLGAS